MGCQRNVDEPIVLGQFERVLVVTSDLSGPDPVAVETVPVIVVPGRDLLDPVADVMGRVLDQLRGRLVFGEHRLIARQEQQEGLGAVMRFRHGLIAVVAVGLDPVLQVTEKALEARLHLVLGGHQVVGEPRKRVVRLILSTPVPSGVVHKGAMVQPLRQDLPQLAVMRVCLFQVAHSRLQGLNGR